MKDTSFPRDENEWERSLAHPRPLFEDEEVVAGLRPLARGHLVLNLCAECSNLVESIDSSSVVSLHQRQG